MEETKTVAETPQSEAAPMATPMAEVPAAPAAKSSKKLLMVVIVVGALVILCLLVVIIAQLILGPGKQGGPGATGTPTPTAIIPTGGEGATGTPTTTVTPSTAIVSIYFGKDPDSFSDQSVTVTSDRPFTGDNKVTTLLTELLKGPSDAEKAMGYFSTFSLSGSSACGTSSFQFSRAGSLLKVKFCKDINPTTSSDGTAGEGLRSEGRMLNALAKTLEVDGVTQIEIRDKTGLCFGLDAGGQNTCTDI
jgi:hypothetical protein